MSEGTRKEWPGLRGTRHQTLHFALPDVESSLPIPHDMNSSSKQFLRLCNHIPDSAYSRSGYGTNLEG